MSKIRRTGLPAAYLGVSFWFLSLKALLGIEQNVYNRRSEADFQLIPHKLDHFQMASSHLFWHIHGNSLITTSELNQQLFKHL